MLDSETSPAPSAALVPTNSAPVLMNSRRRAYSWGGVISELGGGRGEFRMPLDCTSKLSAERRAYPGPNLACGSNFGFGRPRQCLARGLRNVRFVGPARELLTGGRRHERAARLFLQHAFVAIPFGV